MNLTKKLKNLRESIMNEQDFEIDYEYPKGSGIHQFQKVSGKDAADAKQKFLASKKNPDKYEIDSVNTSSLFGHTDVKKNINI